MTEQAGLTKDGKIPRAKKAFLGDAIATTVGSMFGIKPIDCLIVESSTGAAAGGRTGLTATVVAILFAVSIFLFSIDIGNFFRSGNHSTRFDHRADVS